MDNLVFSNYSFSGKHASYVKNLVSDGKNSFFRTNIGLFIVAAYVGLAKNRKGIRELGEEKTKIEKETFMIANTEVYRVLELSVINDGAAMEGLESRLRRLYEGKEVSQEFKDVLESYVLGGLEYLYEHLWSPGATASEKISLMANFVMSLSDEYSNISSRDVVLKADHILS